MDSSPWVIASLIQSGAIIVLSLGMIRQTRWLVRLSEDARTTRTALAAHGILIPMATPGRRPGGGSPDVEPRHPEDRPDWPIG